MKPPKMPFWTRWITLIVLVFATYTAALLWASEAHTDNKSSISSNRARLDDAAGNLMRIEEKLDKLIMHLLPQ